jgi:outer membrane protein assembly factor BamC
MKTKAKALIIVMLSANLSACTYIKNLFPDKEKDYQFTTEIPPLTIPPDLAGGSITNVPAASAAPTADAAPAADPSPEPAPTVERKLIQVELVNADQGTKRLRIGAPPLTAWRMVGKALSRKFMEVTSRNQEEGMFRVLYDPNSKEVEDGGIWDEVVFFLKGFEANEQEYVLKLVENDSQQTDVVILDKEQKPIADEASLSLLTLLHDTIKADLAK